VTHLRPTRRSLLLGGAAAVGAAATSPLLAAPASANTGSISVATANIRYRLPWDQWATDLGRAAYGAHLLAINEAYRYPDELAYWAAVNGWHLYQPAGPGSTNALLARASMFDPVGQGNAHQWGDEGSIKPYPTYNTFAIWREKLTGLTITHLNVHLQRGIEKGGHPGGRFHDDRVAGAQAQIDQALKMATYALGGSEVVLSGDLNIDYVKDSKVKDPSFPFMAWEHGGTRRGPELRSCYSTFGVKPGGTHGASGKRRYIDYIYEYARTRSKRKLAMRGYQFVDLLYSDHDAVLAQFAIDTDGGLKDGSRL
jgi:hypothetical protein